MQQELPPAADGDEDVGSALLLVQGLGWRIEPDSTALRQVSVALRAAEDVGVPLSPDRIDAYAEVASWLRSRTWRACRSRPAGRPDPRSHRHIAV